MYSHKNILIVSLEAENIRTEEIYFKNKKNKGCLSFKNDRKLLERLNIHDVSFLSFNLNANNKKIENKIEKLKFANPSISEIFLLSDRDSKSISTHQINKSIKKFSNSWSKLHGNLKPIYLEYEKEGDNFEVFLRLHSRNKKLYPGYIKTDKHIYRKTMGENGKNLKVLINNIDKSKKCLLFKHLFLTRKDKIK